jgi:hypothetical protein
LLQENHLQAIVTSGPPPWTPFRFLGLALAISIVLAFPIEQVEHDFALPGLSWSHQSCEGLTNDLIAFSKKHSFRVASLCARRNSGSNDLGGIP